MSSYSPKPAGESKVRLTAKLAAIVVCAVLASPLIALTLAEKYLVGRSEAVFAFCAQFLALFPGHVGVCLRAAYYACCLDACSWEVHVGFGSLFTHRGAFIARHVSTGAYCVIGHARIGEVCVWRAA